MKFHLIYVSVETNRTQCFCTANSKDTISPLMGPLTLPFKNFNRATFTTYYIKKAAAKFTLNGVLLMLNAHFCYIKIFLSIYHVYYNFVIIKNYWAGRLFRNIIAPKLKKVEKHCSRPVLSYFFEPTAHFEKFFKLAEHLDQV